ncbi:MAG: cobalamin biosynthesis protein CobQ [Ruminococcus sp.]|jgi:Mrp family chromosome partitioning ATPase|nr:cobalamin biosynthesis protein CobQ [Ruminococcus sp.]
MTYIIIGHYGSGKTNFACNLALKLSQEGSTAIADLDIVNPYFRTADQSEILEAAGVKLVVSKFFTSTLDIPSLTFDLGSAAAEYDNLIIDVGGDDEGAKTLGRYREALSDKPVTVLYVVNFRRYLSKTASDAAEILREIEAASGFRADVIVNNTNLAEETTAETIKDSEKECQKLSKLTGIKEIITVIPEMIDYSSDNRFTVKIIVKKPWN